MVARKKKTAKKAPTAARKRKAPKAKAAGKVAKKGYGARAARKPASGKKSTAASVIAVDPEMEDAIAVDADLLDDGGHVSEQAALDEEDLADEDSADEEGGGGGVYD